MSQDSLAVKHAKLAAKVNANMPALQSGVVTSVDSTAGVATVSIGGGPVPAVCVGSIPAVGNGVIVLQVGTSYVCLGNIQGSGFTGLTAPTNPEPTGVQTHTQIIYPTDSGSYIGGAWTDTRVFCTPGAIGAYFYGGQLDGTLPDAATITLVQVYIDELSNDQPSQAATVGMHSLTAKAGAPSPVAAAAIPAGSGWHTLPTSFGDSFKTGAQLGIATAHGGDHVWAAAGTGQSGALSITWSY